MALSKTLLEQQATIDRNQPNPEWARIPHVGQFLEGHSRSSLFALIKNGTVKSASIKPVGASRTGMRLVFIPSLREFNMKHLDTSTVTATNESGVVSL
jgi:hypothetical protein